MCLASSVSRDLTEASRFRHWPQNQRRGALVHRFRESYWGFRPFPRYGRIAPGSAQRVEIMAAARKVVEISVKAAELAELHSIVRERNRRAAWSAPGFCCVTGTIHRTTQLVERLE
jgi:hypothetical protein